MSVRFIRILASLLAICCTNVSAQGHAKEMTPRSSQLSDNNNLMEKTAVAPKHDPSNNTNEYAAQRSQEKFATVALDGENKQEKSPSVFDGGENLKTGDDKSKEDFLTENNKRKSKQARIRQCEAENVTSSELPAEALAKKLLENQIKELTKQFNELKLQIAMGKLSQQLGKLQGENDSLRSQLVLLNNEGDSHDDEMKVLLQTAVNKTTELRKENEDIRTQLQKVHEDLLTKVTNQRDRMVVLNSSVNTLDGQLNTMKSKFDHQNQYVYFLATFRELSVSVRSGTVHFDKVLANVGNVYNPSTGILTATREGLYVFTVQMFVEGRGSVHWDLCLNGKTALRGSTPGEALNDSNSFVYPVKLHAGDRVCIYSRTPCKVQGTDHSIFGGWLSY